MSDIGILDDFGLYTFVLALITAFGAGVAILERYVLGRFWFWIILLIAGLVGYLMTEWSPFTFAGDDYYMTGVIVSAGAALLLAGYALGALASLAYGQLKRRAKQ